MSCKDIQENGTKQDGEYDMYLSNNEAVKIYCADMNIGTPLEYITLTAGRQNNFAKHYNKTTHRKEETLFDKVSYKCQVQKSESSFWIFINL